MTAHLVTQRTIDDHGGADHGQCCPAELLPLLLLPACRGGQLMLDVIDKQGGIGGSRVGSK